jgi:hypothetical protein
MTACTGSSLCDAATDDGSYSLVGMSEVTKMNVLGLEKRVERVGSQPKVRVQGLAGHGFAKFRLQVPPLGHVLHPTPGDVQLQYEPSEHVYASGHVTDGSVSRFRS